VTDEVRSAIRRQRSGLVILAALGLIAGGISYLGVQASWWPAALSAPAGTAGPELAIDELALPPGPHRETFQAECIICHSARLPLTQPQLNREQWMEIVHKMVTPYGAPVAPEEETQIVEYLLTVQEPGS
jgi:hypothetical protein